MNLDALNSPYWFEAAVILGLTCIGNVVLSAFAEQEPKARRLLKTVVGLGLGIGVSAWLGREWFFALIGVFFIALVVIHGWWLPRLGINGLTAEPREHYRAMRGWK